MQGKKPPPKNRSESVGLTRVVRQPGPARRPLLCTCIGGYSREYVSKNKTDYFLSDWYALHKEVKKNPPGCSNPYTQGVVPRTPTDPPDPSKPPHPPPPHVLPFRAGVHLPLPPASEIASFVLPPLLLVGCFLRLLHSHGSELRVLIVVRNGLQRQRQRPDPAREPVQGYDCTQGTRSDAWCPDCFFFFFFFCSDLAVRVLCTLQPFFYARCVPEFALLCRYPNAPPTPSKPL